jgi:hypothetical protein
MALARTSGETGSRRRRRKGSTVRAKKVSRKRRKGRDLYEKNAKKFLVKPSRASLHERYILHITEEDPLRVRKDPWCCLIFRQSCRSSRTWARTA